MRSARARLAAALLAVAGLGGAALAATGTFQNNEVGPASRIQPSGRALVPAGVVKRVGNFPAGGGVTPDGHWFWTLSAGRGRNDIRIVQADTVGHCKHGRRGRRCRAKAEKRVGRVVQTIAMPGLTGGIAFAPDGRTAYVSGVMDSPHEDQKVDKDVPGRGGDVIHVFRFSAKTGKATRDGVIPVPPPSDAPIPQDFPPTTTTHRSWPRDLAVSGDGSTILAALNLADRAAFISTKDKSVSYTEVGNYPYGAAITRDGRYGLISSETEGIVTVLSMSSGKRVKDIRVGPHLSHPEAIAIDPVRDRAYVAVTHQDLVAVIDTKKLEVTKTLSVGQPEGIGTAPTALSVSRDGSRLLVADSGEDAIAVFALAGSPRGTAAGALRTKAERILAHENARAARLAAAQERGEGDAEGEHAASLRASADGDELIGRIPTASYPTGVGTSTRDHRIAWVAAKGLGVGANPNGPVPTSPNDSDDHINSFTYLPAAIRGSSGVVKFPSARKLAKYSAAAARALRPSNAQEPPPGTPIVAPGAGQKIRHVFYVVRENRTYDQILGDDPRGNGDPDLTLFGERITPNAHALVKRFPLLDHVFANSEASIDGHFWTSAGAVSDYVNKNWHQNYAGRGRPYDFGVYSVTWPAKRFLFDAAQNQGISYFNYGEAVAGVVPLNDKDRTPQESTEVATKLANSDIGPPVGCYSNDASIGKDAILSLTGNPVEVFDSSKPAGAPVTALSRFDCFRARFQAQVLTGSVPAFNYVVLPNDHTQVLTPGARTPNAMIAENDYALGQIVDLISHSSIWNESAILVIEDDSQDGADHVDAHRIPALVISPYAKREAVVHTRFDFLSFIRTLEIITGIKPLNLFDSLAVPLYDAFDADAHNSDPYTAIPPKVDLLERNPATGAAARESAGLNLSRPDLVPQRTLDRLLWQYVHGPRAAPPPPGPNASGVDKGD